MALVSAGRRGSDFGDTHKNSGARQARFACTVFAAHAWGVMGHAVPIRRDSRVSPSRSASTAADSLLLSAGAAGGVDDLGVLTPPTTPVDQHSVVPAPAADLPTTSSTFSSTPTISTTSTPATSVGSLDVFRVPTPPTTPAPAIPAVTVAADLPSTQAHFQSESTPETILTRSTQAANVQRPVTTPTAGGTAPTEGVKLIPVRLDQYPVTTEALIAGGVVAAVVAAACLVLACIKSKGSEEADEEDTEPDYDEETPLRKAGPVLPLQNIYV